MGYDYSDYVTAWRKRAAQAERNAGMARENALRQAWEIARMLGREYGISRAYLFGSLATDRFRIDSDVDLAVEGLAPERYLEALGRIEEMARVPVDLVTMESAGPRLADRIRAEGVIVYERKTDGPGDGAQEACHARSPDRRWS